MRKSLKTLFLIFFAAVLFAVHWHRDFIISRISPDTSLTGITRAESVTRVLLLHPSSMPDSADHLEFSLWKGKPLFQQIYKDDVTKYLFAAFIWIFSVCVFLYFSIFQEVKGINLLSALTAAVFSLSFGVFLKLKLESDQKLMAVSALFLLFLLLLKRLFQLLRNYKPALRPVALLCIFINLFFCTVSLYFLKLPAQYSPLHVFSFRIQGSNPVRIPLPHENGQYSALALFKKGNKTVQHTLFDLNLKDRYTVTSPIFETGGIISGDAINPEITLQSHQKNELDVTVTFTTVSGSHKSVFQAILDPDEKKVFPLSFIASEPVSDTLEISSEHFSIRVPLLIHTRSFQKNSGESAEFTGQASMVKNGSFYRLSLDLSSNSQKPADFEILIPQLPGMKPAENHLYLTSGYYFFGEGHISPGEKKSVSLLFRSEIPGFYTSRNISVFFCKKGDSNLERLSVSIPEFEVREQVTELLY